MSWVYALLPPPGAGWQWRRAIFAGRSSRGCGATSPGIAASPMSFTRARCTWINPRRKDSGIQHSVLRLFQVGAEGLFWVWVISPSSVDAPYRRLLLKPWWSAWVRTCAQMTRTPYLGSDPSQRLNPAHSPIGALHALSCLESVMADVRHREFSLVSFVPLLPTSSTNGQARAPLAPVPLAPSRSPKIHELGSWSQGCLTD